MQKKILTNEQLDALKIYQKTHSDSDTRQYFKLTYTRYHEILKLLGISKHSLSFGRGQSHKTNINNIIELQIIDYYKENANRPTYEKFHIKQKRLLEILMKHGITPHTIEENKKFGQLKLEESMYKKYGVTNYAQSVQYSKTAHKKYYYDKIYFDSSWELALWIYAKDNNKQIEHEPIRLSYIFNNKIHYYFPDFRYDGRLIEIKGCHMLKNNQLTKCWATDSQDRLQAKQLCIEANNVEIWPYAKVKFALDYIKDTYGKNYLKKFKNK